MSSPRPMDVDVARGAGEEGPRLERRERREDSRERERMAEMDDWEVLEGRLGRPGERVRGMEEVE